MSVLDAAKEYQEQFAKLEPLIKNIRLKCTDPKNALEVSEMYKNLADLYTKIVDCAEKYKQATIDQGTPNQQLVDNIDSVIKIFKMGVKRANDDSLIMPHIFNISNSGSN